MWGDYCNFMEMEGKKQREEFIELLLDMRRVLGMNKGDLTTNSSKEIIPQSYPLLGSR